MAHPKLCKLLGRWLLKFKKQLQSEQAPGKFYKRMHIKKGLPPPPHTPPHFLSAAPAASPKIHGKSMENPWVPMGSHGPMGSPWGPMGSPWASMENPRMSEIMDFNENHYSVRQKIGDPGSKSMRNIFPLHPVTSKRPESPYGAKYFVLAENPVFQFFGL